MAGANTGLFVQEDGTYKDVAGNEVKIELNEMAVLMEEFHQKTGLNPQEMVASILGNDRVSSYIENEFATTDGEGIGNYMEVNMRDAIEKIDSGEDPAALRGEIKNGLMAAGLDVSNLEKPLGAPDQTPETENSFKQEQSAIAPPSTDALKL
jgi:hypothetical protein